MGNNERDQSNVVSRKKKKKGSIRSLFMHADAVDLWLMALGSIGTMIEGLLIPSVMFVTAKFMNNYGSGLNSSSVNNKYALILVYLGCGASLAGILEGYCWTRTGERQASRMRVRYLKAVLRQDISYFDLHVASTTEVVNSVAGDSVLIQNVLSEKVPNLLKKVSTVTASYAIAFVLIWRLAILVFPMALLLLVLTFVCGKALMGLAKNIGMQYNKAATIAEQSISCIRTVYAYVGEQKTMYEYSTALEGSVKLVLKQGLTKGLLIGFTRAFGFLKWSFVCYYGSRMVMYHGAQGGTVYALGVCTAFGAQTLATGLSDLKPITEACYVAERIKNVIKRVPKIDLEMKGKIINSTGAGEIDFKNVEFAYPSRPGSIILRNFSLQVPAGKSLALVGGSGSGKSTVISLLQRFYDPLGGEILFDGVPIDKLELKWLRSQMGLVSQEPILFDTSVKENILFGKEDATMEEIIEAAKASNIHDFISQLPQGYDTQVGERGIQMSGGQKQRIAIARAMIRAPRILLLDEATSALDSESERLVQAALDKAVVGCTTIIIAHRLSTIRNAHIIAVIQNGTVMELGSHEGLIKDEQGLYTSMVHLQQNEKQEILEETNEDTTVLHAKNAVSHRISMASWSSSPLPQTPSRPTAAEENITTENEELSGPSFRRLLALNLPEWKEASLASLSAAIHGAIHPVFSFVFGSMLSVYFLKDHEEMKEKIRFYSLFFFALALFTLFVTVCQHYYFAYVAENLAKRTRERMLSKILTFEVGWFDQDRNFSAAICSRLTRDGDVVRSLVTDQISLLVQSLSSVTIAAIMSLVIAWRLAIVIIALQPLIIMCFYIRRFLLESLSGKSIKAQEESSKLAAEAVSNVRTITVFSSQNRILRLLEKAQEGPKRESIRQSWLASLGLSISNGLRPCIWALVYWFSGVLISRSYIDAKAFFEVYLILVTTSYVISDAGNLTSDLAKAKDSVRSVFSLLDRLTKIDSEVSENYQPGKIIGHVEFCHVDFAYPTRPDVIIFSDFSINIEVGKTTALVGHSGSGKSTIVSLIERFYDPLKGVVKIDGRDLRLYHLKSLRKYIALVSQEPLLFAGSIKENITYGISSEINEAEIFETAKLANAHDFISGLPEGYNTWCGDKGVQLSGGQKQRIAIARAILKNPTILLLDEATSALDSESEKVVQEALERVMVGKTSVVVAHRLSTIQNCDQIAVLDKGKVVEKGTHSSLLAKGPIGAYYSLVNLQRNSHNSATAIS